MKDSSRGKRRALHQGFRDLVSSKLMTSSSENNIREMTSLKLMTSLSKNSLGLRVFVT